MIGDRPTPGVAEEKPNAARMHNYYLGGKDNFRTDREAVDRLGERLPNVAMTARANRRFLLRAARYCAEQGVDQFVEFDVGIPTSPSVHEVVRAVRPGATFVGVDHDPVALCHARALMDDGAAVRVIKGDIRSPDRVLADPALRRVVDLDRPVAVLLVGVAESILDDHWAARVVRTLRSAMAPGSFLVLSHATSTGSDASVLERFREVYARSTRAAVPRRRDQIHDLLEGFHLVNPGLVDVQRWHPGDGVRESVTRMRMLGAVGVNP